MRTAAEIEKAIQDADAMIKLTEEGLKQMRMAQAGLKQELSEADFCETLRKRAEVMLARADGAMIENITRGREDIDNWVTVQYPSWNWSNTDYRVKATPPAADTSSSGQEGTHGG